MVIRIAGTSTRNAALIIGAALMDRCYLARKLASTCDNVNEILNDSGRTQTCRQMRECGCCTRRRIFHAAQRYTVCNRFWLVGQLVLRASKPMDIPSDLTSIFFSENELRPLTRIYSLRRESCSRLFPSSVLPRAFSSAFNAPIRRMVLTHTD